MSVSSVEIERVETIAATLGRIVRGVGSLAELSADDDFRDAPQPFVVILDRSGDPEASEAVLSFVEQEGSRGTYVYVADELAGNRYKRLLRSGSAEWLSWAALESELPALALGRSPLLTQSRGARLWGVLPSKGGSGATTLAVEAAVSLSERRSYRNRKLALVELDIQGGTLADALDVEPRLDLPEVIAHPDRLDDQLVDAFTSRFSPRLDVFASPKRWAEPHRLEPQPLFGFLDLIAARYDDVILDLPSGWHAWRDDLLRGLDGLIVCGADTVPAVRQLRSVVGDLAGSGLQSDRVALAINRCELDVFGRPTRRTELERAFPDHCLIWIRNDAAAISHAENGGQPLAHVSASSRVARDFRAATDWLEKLGKRTDASVPDAPERAA